MEFRDESIIKPLPTEEYILKKEKAWRVKLPKGFRNFIKEYGGAKPEKSSFICNNHSYNIERFLCILSEYRTHELGMYDIGVVLTQIEDRLSDNPNLVGVEILPIAILFSGDFLCLDFRDLNNPGRVCVWSHEDSEIDCPVTHFVCNSFEEFENMLF